MPNLTDVHNQIYDYLSQYRPFLKLEESGKYLLFPPSDSVVTEKDGKEWPGKFPFAKRHGIYLIFNNSDDLLYIGKASMNNNLESRLGSYFSYQKDRSCNINHKWSSEPTYIITIAVPENMSFEAPALEEFLISEFGANLPDNRAGTGKTK